MTTCLREAVEKGLWQSFAAAALLERVLACKDAEALWAVKGGGELRDEDRRAVVEARVEPLEHRLPVSTETRALIFQGASERLGFGSLWRYM